MAGIGWKYYNHAAVPVTAPHESPDMTPIEDKTIWKMERKPLFALWITDFDCGYETDWWYVIKDEAFDVSSLKAKRRYEINKGIRNFDVYKINPADHKEEIYRVRVAAYTAYPEKYRPTVSRQASDRDVEIWSEYVVFGAFLRQTHELCGYAVLSETDGGYVDFYILKTDPQHEKNAVNAALVEGILKYFCDFLSDGGYICDGSRTINHETAFQDYLEKYFGFRKAYCNLHMEYNPKVKLIMRILYPMRKIIKKMDAIRVVHQINSVLQMEEIARRKNGRSGIDNNAVV